MSNFEPINLVFVGSLCFNFDFKLKKALWNSLIIRKTRQLVAGKKSRNSLSIPGKKSWISLICCGKIPAKFVDRSWKNIMKFVSMSQEKKILHFVNACQISHSRYKLSNVRIFYVDLFHIVIWIDSLTWSCNLKKQNFPEDGEIFWTGPSHSPYSVKWVFKIVGANPTILPWNSSPAYEWR